MHERGLGDAGEVAGEELAEGEAVDARSVVGDVRGEEDVGRRRVLGEVDLGAGPAGARALGAVSGLW
ncbi:hypothetical protein V7793_11490 [Streptomyces sp. KLMMK]|uniref:hypothetical protein n=1 Tax=Streptomyces sp. KLMMK TaxID=3109353 RepID=UPI00300AE5AC